MIRPELLWMVAGLFFAAEVLPSEPGNEPREFFEQRVRPLLVEHCYKCHSAQADKLKGGLLLDTKDGVLKGGDSGPALVPGDPEKSLLIKAVRSTDKDVQMPPREGGGKKLSDVQIADLVAWVKRGAYDPRTGKLEARTTGFITKSHWAFQPVKIAPIPEVKDTHWPKSPLDHFILAKLEEKNLKPAPPTEKRTLIRRATFDLTGLPPASEEIDAFLADDSPGAFAKVVERLLGSPHYGEHWGRHWLDVVRYADTAGETADYPAPLAWRYRNYVIDTFNADMPYDQFIREQIAGDILARMGPREKYAERIIATGYLAASRRFGFDSENYHYLTIEDTIDTLGKSILGLSISCARCHDHKYDPLTTSDYYGLYGIFESTRYAFPGSEQKQKVRALTPIIPPAESSPKWQQFHDRVDALAHKLEGLKLPAPSGILRSLEEMDGDFELQAISSGGSRGVLVPPWIYEGQPMITKLAQSPFRNLYRRGQVGVSLPASNTFHRVAQKLWPGRMAQTGDILYFNADFRASPDAAQNNSASWRFYLGHGQEKSTAVEAFVSADSFAVRNGDRVETIRSLKPGRWNNLQLTVNLKAKTFSGMVGTQGERIAFSDKALSSAWDGTIDFFSLDARGHLDGPRPLLEADNIAVQERRIPSPDASSEMAASDEPDPARIMEQLNSLAGMDGDFELQQDGAPPTKPWRPGPQSAVKIKATAQSPFRNIYPGGRLGISMGNSSAYDGFVQDLDTAWKLEKCERLYCNFDLRGASNDAGGDGSWRFYLGHGPGKSAAVEMFFNSTASFLRSGDSKEKVRPLEVARWYNVQLQLDLKERTYRGTIGLPGSVTNFSGKFAPAWDGIIDCTFIDSYGHIAGVRPGLEADNFAIQPSPLPGLDSPPVEVAEVDFAARREQVAELRLKLDELQAGAEQAKQEILTLLARGPCDLAYGVVEGTPRNARIQLRGDPEKLGREVERGFPDVLGGDKLPPESSGSGRYELAGWLTRPDNPLTSRVMANRIWQYHFGRGLVATPNDFGTRGTKPSHPELLDYLAERFIAGGWSIKKMHREIMLSQSYQMASQDDPQATELDPGNEFYGRFNRRRLEAEAVRDSMLAISGELDQRPGQEHPFPPPTSWGFTQHAPFGALYDHNRRSVYLMTQRIKRHPFFALFDGADPNASTPERRLTTVPTQALFFLNDAFVHSQAEKFAARILAARAEDAERVELAYQQTLGRPATGEERADALKFLSDYTVELSAAGISGRSGVEAAWAGYARVLFSSNEFIHVD